MENQDIFLRNNTGTKSKSAIVEGFVVRTNEFEQIKSLLNKSKTINDLQNLIIVGQRGAGKTTLIHRLNYAILDDKSLNNRYLPILFSEEQYNLSDLTNLWEAIAIEIEDCFYKEDLTTKISDFIEFDMDFEKKSFDHLQNFLITKNKVAILFIENVNFFLKKLSEDEKRRLKIILTSQSCFRIIGTSTTYDDGSIDVADPFYNFFKIIQLDGLTQEECEKLLIKIGQMYGEEQQIREIIENFPGRVEALRRLTGGVPRTISYLFQIFLDNENGKAIKDLYLLIDTLTLQYKSELDKLSTQQQKVIDAIARKWDAISVKEITKRTRLESKNISSILSYLEKNQLVEKVQTSTKNHLYRIKERFMNIWYLMRFGRKHDKDNVIWLVRFFDAWCDESELTKRLKKHINNLKDGKYDAVAAIDMGNTFLSCENIPDTLKEELIKTTNSVLPDRLLKNTKPNQIADLVTIKKLIKERKLNEAADRLIYIENKNNDYYMLATSIYLMQEDINKALEAAKSALDLDSQNSFTYLTLGIIYDLHLKNPEAAIEYYKKCLSLPHPHPYAANRLGIIYKKRKDYENAIKYHKLAISKNFKLSLKPLGEIYLELDQLENAEKYLLDAAKAKIEGANTSLARVFTKLKKKKETEIALKEAIAANEENANINLGLFYLMHKRPDFAKAKDQFIQAIEKGDIEGYNQLARLYVKNKQISEAIRIYEDGLAHGSAESAHQLGHIWNKKEEFEKSDEMFAKAIEFGDVIVVHCWIHSIYDAQRNDKKLLAKELLEKYKPATDSLSFDLLYAKILLWNEEISNSLEIFNKQVKKITELFQEESENDRYSHRIISELVEYFLLLIARKDYQIVLDLFNESQDLDFKSILKPVYYLLMEELKDEFPSEYLKAGKELTETINDLRKEVENLRKSNNYTIHKY